MTVKLIIDTDPGIDDAMAIFYAAAAPDIDLLGLTTVYGNVPVGQATRNALRLLQEVGLDIPVAPGADRPRILPPHRFATHIHGDNGLGDIPEAAPRARPDRRDAIQFITQTVSERPGEVTICAIGPLTNIAAALDADATLARKIRQIVVMGGSIDAGGNITDHAEANIYHDPHAAEAVFASGARIMMVGLDVTHKVLCSPSDFSNIAKNAPRLGGLLQDMSHFYIAFYESVGKFDGCSLHDPSAVIACTHDHLFKTLSTPVRVALDGETRGRTTAGAERGRPAINVAVGVDAVRVKAVFEDHLARLD